MKIEFSPFFVCKRERESACVCTKRERESVGESACVFVQERERERVGLNKERKGDAEKILLLICPR